MYLDIYLLLLFDIHGLRGVCKTLVFASSDSFRKVWPVLDRLLWEPICHDADGLIRDIGTIISIRNNGRVYARDSGIHRLVRTVYLASRGAITVLCPSISDLHVLQ